MSGRAGNKSFQAEMCWFFEERHGTGDKEVKGHCHSRKNNQKQLRKMYFKS